MDNKPTPKWSIDKDNNLVPYKKKKINTMTQEAKTQSGKHMIGKITNSYVVDERDITNSSSCNTNNILQTHNIGNSQQGDDETNENKFNDSVCKIDNSKKNKNNSTCINTSTYATSSDDESAPLYAINLEICATLSSESFSESDNDDICNNHSTVTEINDDICNKHSTVTEMNIKEIEDVLDNNHVYTQYTDDNESESDKQCIGKKKCSFKKFAC